MSYTTDVISAGKLVADSISITASGSNVASLEAVDVQVANLVANSVNAQMFSFDTLSLDISGNLVVDGSTSLNTLGVSGLASLTTLGVSGVSNLHGTNVTGTLAVTGSETVSGALAVTGVSNLHGTNVVGTLAVTGSETVSANLGVSGTTNLQGTNVTGTLAVTGSETVSGTVTAGSLVAAQMNVAGTTIDVSGNLIVGGSSTVHSLDVLGTTYLTGGVTIADNLAVQANEYIAGNLYSNKGVVVGDSSNGTGVALSVAAGTTTLAVAGSETVSGNLSVSGNVGVSGTANLQGTNITGTLAVTGSETVSGSVGVVGAVSAGSLSVGGTTVDVSGNLIVAGNSVVHSLDVLGTTYLTGGVTLADNLAVLANEYIAGNLYSNKGVVVGDSSNGTGVSLSVAAGTTTLAVAGSETVSANLGVSGTTNLQGTNVTGTLAVTGSETVSGSVGVAGAVTAGSLSVGGTTIDTSGNLTVAGNSNVHSLDVLGTASFEAGVNFTQSAAVDGGFYTQGGAYINNALVVGDGADGNGVSMMSSGTTMNVYGVTQDSSAIAFPVTLSVKGSIDVSNNLTVNGNFNLNGLNLYEGNYQPGDIISFIKKGTMPAALTNGYMQAAINVGGNTAYTDTSYNIDFYEMIYWGVDSRSNDLTRMSATLLVPSTVINNTILSFKHGTITSPVNEVTIWYTMSTFLNSGGTNPGSYDVQFAGWWFASTGYVTIVADNPGYGVSVGTYNYSDTIGEPFSQYHAVVATKQFIQKYNNLIPTPLNGAFSAPYKIINSGYSLGGLFGGTVSQLIAADISFKLLNTIPGAPVNSYKIITGSLFDSSGNLSTNRIGDNEMFISCLYFNGNRPLNTLLYNLQPNFVNNILPMFDEVYLNTQKNTNLTAATFFSLVIERILKNNPLAITDYSGNPWYLNPSSERYYQPSFFINPNVTMSSYFDALKSAPFYTNTFSDFTDLSGIPMSVIYSLQDDLCCYDTANPYVGNGPTTDLVYDDLQTFYTTPGQYGNYLDASGKYVDTVYTVTPLNINTTVASVVGYLIASETTKSIANLRFDTTALGGLTHQTFGLSLWGAIISNYLKNRT